MFTPVRKTIAPITTAIAGVATTFVTMAPPSTSTAATDTPTGTATAATTTSTGSVRLLIDWKLPLIVVLGTLFLACVAGGSTWQPFD